MPNPNKKFVRTVFDEYHDELHRYLLSRLRGRTLDAADVAQETYLRLLRMKNADAVQQPHAYVYRVAANVMRELGLKEQAQEQLPERLTDPSMERDPAEAPDTALDRQIRLEHLARALRSLPPTTQAILLLKKRDGLTRQEIAQELGISEHTVKKHLLKAVAWCRERGLPDRERGR